MLAYNILDTIGNTPHVKINRLFPDNIEVWIKLERSNPGGSIKDRIALNMIEDAEARGVLNPDSVIIEPTSGNTGIGLAVVAAAKGYKLILVMPESMSIERRKCMTALGAKLDLTPKEKGMQGSIDRAKEIQAQTPNAWIPQQFENPANPDAHRKTTSQEILTDFPEGLDYIIAGIGTGGHISGVGEVLKEQWPNLKVYGVEPEASPVLNGGEPGPHPLQGIGAGFAPKVLNQEILAGVIKIGKDEAYDFTTRCAREEGIFLGISSGASLAAINKQLPEIPAGSKILTFCYDLGDRYLSVEGLFE